MAKFRLLRDLGAKGRQAGVAAGIVVASGIAGIASQLIAARSLGPAEYGELAAYYAIAAWIMAAAGGLQVEVAAAGENRSEPELDRVLVETPGPGVSGPIPLADRRVHFGEAVWPTVVVTALVVPAFLYGSGWASWFFLIVAGAITSLQMSIVSGEVVRRGHENRYLLLNICGNLLRLALSVVVAVKSLGVLGFALIPIVVSWSIGTWGVLSQRIPMTARGMSSSRIAQTTVAILLFYLATNVDVILAPQQMLSSQAGSYAAAASLTRVPIIIAAMIGYLSIPRFKNCRSPLREYALISASVLMMALLYGAAIVLGASQVVLDVLGQEYATTSEIIVPLAMASLPWTLVASTLYISAAIRSSRVLMGTLLLAALVSACLYLGLSTPTSFAAVFGSVGLIALLAATGITAHYLRAVSRVGWAPPGLAPRR